MNDNVPDEDLLSRKRPAISVQRISKRYYTPLQYLRSSRKDSTGKLSLNEVSFSVNPGETVALLGPNGAGKTTVLKCIATLIYPSSGSISIFGNDTKGKETKVRGWMGLVTCDERSFYWRLSGRQNLQFFSSLYGITKNELARRSEPMLETLGLAKDIDRPYHTYSSGMKQKLAIIRGLLKAPKIVLYDEPSRSLDPLSTDTIHRWLLEKRSQHPEQTHLIATNQLSEAEKLCDRVVIINSGRILADASLDELKTKWTGTRFGIRQVVFSGVSMRGYSNPDSKGSSNRLREQPLGKNKYSLEFMEEPGSDDLTKVLTYIVDNGGVIHDCRKKQLGLDDIFMSELERDRKSSNS